MNNQITYKDIAVNVGKSEHTVKQWKQRFPKLLEYCKLGTFCEKNNITIDMIKNCIELKEMAKRDNV